MAECVMFDRAWFRPSAPPDVADRYVLSTDEGAPGGDHTAHAIVAQKDGAMHVLASFTHPVGVPCDLCAAQTMAARIEVMTHWLCVPRTLEAIRAATTLPSPAPEPR